MKSGTAQIICVSSSPLRMGLEGTLFLLYKSVACQRRTAHPKGVQGRLWLCDDNKYEHGAMRSIARMLILVATREHAVRSGA